MWARHKAGLLYGAMLLALVLLVVWAELASRVPAPSSGSSFPSYGAQPYVPPAPQYAPAPVWSCQLDGGCRYRTPDHP